MKLGFVGVLLAFSIVVRAEDSLDPARQDCLDDNLCFIKVAGAQCADGTQSGFSVVYRKGAKNLFLYLNGGGACWSKETCEKGTASHLTAGKYYEGPYFEQDPAHLEGWADLNNPANPIHENYNIARVEYCTGDIFMGDRIIDYGTTEKPYVVRHVGYRNIDLELKEIQKRFPNPDQILFMGTSAGGLGVTFNLHQLRSVYPKNKVFMLNDGGLPFKSPHVGAKNLEDAYTSWGAHQTAPVPTRTASENLATAMLDYNQVNYPEVAFGYIGSYKDWTMSLFSKLLGAVNFATAVRSILIDLADNEYSKASNYKVFYLQDFWHGYARKDPSKVVSKGTKFSDWMAAMLSESHGWEDVRPDKP